MERLKLYFSYFKNKILKKYEDKKAQSVIDTEEIKEEIWAADFSKKGKARFIEETGDGYQSLFEENLDGKHSYSLELKRKHLYAWALNPLFRYKDFVLDAEIELPVFTDNFFPEENTSAGYCAAGFVFRHISDKAFYSLLISDKGWIRLEAVVNSTPMPILGWTKPLTDADSSKFKIKLICAGTNITVLVNNTWLGKFDSDIVQAAGKIGFAGQNWESYPKVKFYLNEFKIISQPLLVENTDSAANNPDAISPEAYINLASTYYAMGQYVAAIYQIKQAWKLREPTIQDHILAGRIYFAQRLNEEAEKEFLSALDIEHDNYEIMAELAGLYYQSGNMKKLGDILKSIPNDEIEKSVLLCSLKGHFLNSQGEHEKSASFYARAFELKPDQGLLKYNEANELNLAGKKTEAVDSYVEAGKLFLASEEYNEMADVINALERIAPEDERTWALSGKFYYAVDNKWEAKLNFKKLCDAKTSDSTIWYLYGLLIHDENPEEAIKFFKKACKLGPEHGLYHFRLAESLYLIGEDCSVPLLEAEALEPNNGWVFNLKALCAIDEDAFFDAQIEIEKARKMLPDEIVILENYVEVMRLQGRLKECAPLFDIEAGTADLAAERNRAEAFHVYANALFFDEQYDEADIWYQKALKLKPVDPVLLTDKAENSIQIGYLNDADGLLVKAMDIEPTERIYRLIALLAVKKGDHARAEVSLRQAIEEFGESEELLFDLTNLYIQTNRKEKAKETIKLLTGCDDQERLKELKALLKK